MEDLRKKKAEEERNKEIRNQNILIFIKKHKWKIIISLLSLTILFFPVSIGTFIGQFITDFLGSIIKNINI